MGRRAPEPAPELLGLTALVPEPDNDQHALYADELVALLRDDARRGRVWNIALTGAYGSGKSSVLAALRARLAGHDEEDRIVQISLSSLSDVGVHPTGGDSAGSTALTNYIQKEIVKQLLYRERPGAVPGSRFRRISRPSKARALATSLLGAIVVTAVFWITGWGAPLDLPADAEAQRPLILAGIGALTALVLFTAQLLFKIHWRLDKIGTASTSVTLAPNDTGTYFDEYLDEIVYFFEMTRCDIVLIEDLDRFEDPSIYASLRELNTLLNASGQLRAKPVHFIYAVRDSIFEDLEQARRNRAGDPEPAPHPDERTGVWQADARLAEPATQRTKFFELVIPIVPFITHRSAVDLLAEMMTDIDDAVDFDAIRIVGTHITDMRLLRNITNEYLVFRARVLGPGAPRGLNRTRLFALVAYKNTHLEDFEEIRVGNSLLDTVYRRSRRIIVDGLAALTTAHGELIASRQPHADTTARADRLGAALQALVERWLTSAGRSAHQVVYHLDGRGWSTDEVRDPDFWGPVIDRNRPVEVHDPQGRAFTLTAATLRADLGDLVPGQWAARADQDTLDAIAANLEQQRRLRAADLGDLFEDDLDAPHIDDVPFEKWIDTLAHHDPLLTDLIRARLLDRNFPLYASQFYGLVASEDAMTYVVQHLQTEQPDANFPLAPADVPAVLRLGGKHVYGATGLFNIAIYDALLPADPRLDANLQLLATRRPDAIAFLGAYLHQGAHPELLGRRLAAFWPGVFDFIETELADRPALRDRVAVAAFTGTDPERDYRLPPDLKQTISRDARAQIPELTNPELSPQRTVAALSQLGIRLHRLGDLSPAATRAVIDAGQYDITPNNLEIVTGGPGIGLDALLALGDGTFDHVMHHFDAYLHALDMTGRGSVDDADTIVDVLSAVEHALPGRAADIEARIPGDLEVADLDDVPLGILPVLADGGRFRFDCANLATYYQVVGSDPHLIRYLAQREDLDVPDTVPDSERARLANLILNERDLPIPARIAHTARLVTALPATPETAEEPDLVAALVHENLLPDTADTFHQLRSIAAQEAFLRASPTAPAYFLELNTRAELIARLLRNDEIGTPLKTLIADALPNETGWYDPAVYEAIGEWIEEHPHPLAPATARLILDASIPAPAKAAVLGNAAALLGYDTVASATATLDGAYPRLLERSTSPVDIPADPDFTAALQVLRNGEDGPVSSWDPGPHATRVWMRHPQF